MNKKNLDRLVIEPMTKNFTQNKQILKTKITQEIFIQAKGLIPNTFQITDEIRPFLNSTNRVKLEVPKTEMFSDPCLQPFNTVYEFENLLIPLPNGCKEIPKLEVGPKNKITLLCIQFYKVHKAHIQAVNLIKDTFKDLSDYEIFVAFPALAEKLAPSDVVNIMETRNIIESLEKTIETLEAEIA